MPTRKANYARLLLAAAFFLVMSAAAGASLETTIRPTFAGAPLHFDSLAHTNAAGETLSVTRLDFLLSNLALHRAGGMWLERTNWQAFFSLAGGRVSFRAREIPAGNYDQLRFHVGVPKEFNHSDSAKYPAEHPLNPNLNGLHWSWQGGYIFLALEGAWRSAPTAGTTRNQPDAPGGYSYHFANDWNLTEVTLPVALDLNRDASLQLDFDVAEALHSLSLAKDGTSTHSREGDPIAAQLAANLSKAFRAASLQKNRPDQLQSFSGASPPAENTVAAKPLYLPSRFTPYRFGMSRVFPVPDLPKNNPLIEERIALGRALFHEPKLSRDGSLSCASCHDERAAFSDSRRFSLGVGGRAGARQAMPLLNLAWKSSFFWDGRAPSLRAQALMPIQDHMEMDETLERVMKKLAASSTPDYPALFARAFVPPEITAEKIGLALESFVLTLTSFDSKFDRVMRGENIKLTAEEQRGFELFFTEYDPRREQFGADCFHCHGGANFSNHGFANNGLDASPTDPGRFNVTRRESDRGKFSVPSLRNVAVSAPYMHDGRFATLTEVVAHYSTGVKRSATLDPNLAKHPDGGVALSAADQRALVAFLQTLTDGRFTTSEARKNETR